MLAIKYHGSGHYRGNAAARDAVKKEALHKAGAGYLEFIQSDRDDQIRSRVREKLGWETATSAALVQKATSKRDAGVSASPSKRTSIAPSWMSANDQETTSHQQFAPKQKEAASG